MKRQKSISALASSNALQRVMGYGCEPINIGSTTPLSENGNLIIKEWTSKNGVEYVLYDNCGMNLQLEKKSVQYYKVAKDGRIL